MWKGPVLTYCFGKFSEKGTQDCVHLALSTGLIPDGWTLDSIADNELHFFKVRCRPFRYCTLLLKHVFIIGQLICNLKWSKRLPYCLELRICFQATQSLLKLICKILSEYGSCNQMVSARQILCLFISYKSYYPVMFTDELVINLYNMCSVKINTLFISWLFPKGFKADQNYQQSIKKTLTCMVISIVWEP